MMTAPRAVLAHTLAGVVALVGTAGPTAAYAAPAPAAKPTTTVTLTLKNCDGCTVTATSVLRADYTDVWTSPTRKVVNDQVRLRVPTDRTRGLSLALDAPWEGNTGYQTVVALRYRGQDIGDRVTFAEARASRRASGCWAGTTDATAALKVKVRKVRVPGNTGMVPGTIAWAKVTPAYLFPMQRSWDGVLGTQDLFGCGPA